MTTDAPRNPLLLGHAEPFVDDDEVSVQPRAGDICRLRGWPGLWIPYGGIGNELEQGSFRFARFPKVDRVQLMDVALVNDVIVPAEFEEARAAWDRITALFPDGGSFARKVFVYRRGADGEVPAYVFDADGRELGMHVSRSLAHARFDIDRHLPLECEIVWCVGRAELEARVLAGELRGVRFATIT